MESKKINQLATELAPDLSDLTIIGDPTTGISKKITLSQMASLFTGTVEEYANLAAFPLVGVADTIYIALDTNVLYRWDTGLTSYVELSPNIINSLVFSDANGFDGNISLVGSVATLTITTALTTGSVPFIGASGALSQDNANLFFDDTNNRLGINTNAPTTALDVFGSGIIGRINGTSTNNAFLGFASAGTNKWSIGNVQSDHRFRIYNEATTSELVSVLQTGEVGIGIANPLTKFHIDGGASALIANLDANVSVAKSLSFRSDNSNRINLEVSGTESGSNAGADFFIRRYSDAGSLIDTPLTITRSTGAIDLTGALSGTTASFSGQISTSSGLISVSGNAAATPPSGFVGLRLVANRLIVYGGSTDFTVQKNSNSGPNLTILESGAATFISSVTAINYIANTGSTNTTAYILNRGSSSYDGILEWQDNTSSRWKVGTFGTGSGDLRFFSAATGGYPLTLNYGSGAATFTGEVNVTSGLLSMSGSGGTPPTSGVGLRFVANRLLIYGGTEDITFQKNSNASANMRILEAGNVLIGTNTDRSFKLVVEGTDNNNLMGSYNTTSGTSLRMQSNQTINYIVSASNQLQFEVGAAIRMTMTTGGDICMGATSSSASSRLTVIKSSSDYVMYVENTNNTSGDKTYRSILGSNTNNTNSFHFSANSAGTDRLYIYGNGNVVNSNNSYGQLSDIKVKENISDATSKLENLLKVRIVNFNFKNDDKKQIGVIAQELEQIFPSMIDETEDFEEIEVTDEEGNVIKEKQSLGTTTKSVKYSVFVPMLIKAMQEQQAQIEELKALINK